MKFLKSTLLLAITAIMAVSCQESLRVDNFDKSANMGYLQLSALNVELVTDHKPVDGGVDTRSQATRASVDINTFDCSIYDESGSLLVTSFKYGSRPADVIELEAGKYIFKMCSGEVNQAAFDAPQYGLTEPFTIIRKETTSLTNLVCTLQNIQASISYSADLRAALSDDTTATLTVGSSSLVFGVDETRSGYFKAEKALNDIDVLVKGMYTQEGKEPAAFEFTTTIKDVKAGQHSDIQLYIEYSGEGNISISVTIDGWVVDENIVFDLAQLISEDTMVDDDDKPTVVLVGGDIDSELLLAQTDFDNSGNCTKNVIVDITTQSTIASLVTNISSTNAEMIASLSEYGLGTSLDLCNAGAASGALKLMGLPVNDQVLGKQSVSYDITAQMKLLKEFVGTHTFAFTVTDAQGGATEKALVIVIEGEQVGPTVVWKGYNIDQRYTVNNSTVVDIVVSATAGIKEFTVKIVSDVLTPSQLSGVGLCDVLNLTDPDASYSTVDDNFDTSSIATSMNNLGFPTGDAVKNQTSVEFSITNFIPLLSMTGSGDHDFIMTVTDNDGNTTVKTLMITTVQQ
ncbi:MAG: DUF4493 domain-containing protein [Alistipes sp.]|nr:DUF4493 domain-containing protein [Alistipes sp.]